MFGLIKGARRKTLTLGEAAARVLETAEREDLALLDTARRYPSGPESWFADNMLRVAAVHGKHLPLKDAARVTVTEASRLTPATDMRALRENAKDEIADLRITADDFHRYLKWVRSVQ